MTDTDRVVVVGAGIAGASAADHLARGTDAEVLVLERGTEPADETTARSGAFVGFWGHESAACVPLLRYGIRYYGRLLSAAGTTARFVHGGRLRLATTAAGDDAIRTAFESDFDRTLRESTASATATKGAPVQYLSGETLDETLVLPGLATDTVTGALYSPGVGYVDDPAALARAVLDRARESGATVETNTTVTGLQTEGGRVTGVRTTDGRRRADAVVAAAGPWNRRLLDTAGVTLPVRNTRGPMLALDTDEHGLPALYHEESGVYTRQNRDGSLFVGHFPGQYDDASVLDPDAIGDDVQDARHERSLDVIRRLCPGTRGASVVDEWVGVRTVTPDGDPILGPTDVDGLSVLAFNANGIQYAPAAGRLVAAEVGGFDPGFPTAGVAFDRLR
ncbi:NAD(P)/FAD-dependent oxidoreductase [Haloarchaeobius litoreus]|uniref:NAD(P)/FAD-dependent oxidoreductase n=1 Tax=Haloarchaeobius litoreus TaxID=755306 RepID=A0ABD6DJC3_9EURY|nr:FAD-dependent oxidoreductase [Haloarchaeobius litoreus]